MSPFYGETPYVQHEIETNYRRLFYSRPEQALITDITLAAGYGILKAGTVLALNKSAAGNYNKYVPYNPTTAAYGDPNQVGRAFLIDTPSGTTVNVVLQDSYKFVVGDDLIIDDDNSAAENLGAITAIDRTTYVHIAAITVTATISGTFTLAQNGFVCVEAGDSSNIYSDAVGILGATVDTGLGEKAKGALAPMIRSNAILYDGLLTNIDAASRTDLSATLEGRYLIIK
jgi:hypothetical protein